MKKEDQFGTVLYDEQEHLIRCMACKRPVNEKKLLFRHDGQWVCGKCLCGVENTPTQCTLCSTAKAAVEG